jgi:hypothetical protein
MAVLRAALAMGLVGSLFWNPNTADAQAVQRVDELVARLQAEVQSDPELAHIRITAGEIVPRRLGTDYDLRLVGEGGLLADRVRAANAVRTSMLNNPDWRAWLEANDVVITWFDLTADSELLQVVDPTDEEGAAILNLLMRVQDEIDLDPDLSAAGTLVVSAVLMARMDEPGIGRELRVYGRVATPEQATEVARLFAGAMADLPYWRDRRGDFFVSLGSLSVAPTSAVFAQRYFAMGLMYFWEGHYRQADAAFMRAVAESPADPVYRYWRVVSLLAMGEQARAEVKLRPLLVQNPWGQFAPTIAVALERLQGPLRWELQRMERHVLLTLIP